MVSSPHQPGLVTNEECFTGSLVQLYYVKFIVNSVRTTTNLTKRCTITCNFWALHKYFVQKFNMCPLASASESLWPMLCSSSHSRTIVASAQSCHPSLWFFVRHLSSSCIFSDERACKMLLICMRLDLTRVSFSLEISSLKPLITSRQGCTARSKTSPSSQSGKSTWIKRSAQINRHDGCTDSGVSNIDKSLYRNKYP